MIRSLHRWFGLASAIVLTIVALSGTVLSIYPISAALTAPAAQNVSVAELATRVQAELPTVEQIRYSSSGQITAFYFDGDQPISSVIDPASGKPVGNAEKSELERWLVNFHRSLFLDDNGRYAVAAAAFAMFALSISGLYMLARRAGGWRFIFKPVRGRGESRLHTYVSRLALPGLVLSSLTGLWMVAATFSLLPEGAASPMLPATVSGQTGVALNSISLLQNTPIDELRSLNFPLPDDSGDAYQIKTSRGEGYIDQGNGELLAWSDVNWVDVVSHYASILHTGEGFAWLGLILGLSALGMPVLGWTGLIVWYRGRRRGSHIASVSASHADTIVLVGSEGGTTWSFASTLHSTLTKLGLQVHVGSMASFDPDRWPKAKRVILLAATYGDGAAPSSVANFMQKFSKATPPADMKLSVLGFGDRSFPAFCGFAEDIAKRAAELGWNDLVPYETIDRQSPQDFSRWGRDLSAAMKLDFELNHIPVLPKTWQLELVSRRDYGANVQAATAILRFALPHATFIDRLLGRAFPSFEAGDLVAIVPEGSSLPRFYSLASGSHDGFLEICVRKHPGGLCSGQLTSLEPGEMVTAFVRANPDFRPQRGRKPVILIGAGTGIGPLAGFARSNHPKRPLHLYFGTRHPASDALYAEELAHWQSEGRLAAVSTAFSRAANPAYVQDVLRKDAAKLGKLLASGGQVLVCGGRDMAAGVADALSDILAAHGLSLATLKAEGRYAEDVY